MDYYKNKNELNVDKKRKLKRLKKLKFVERYKDRNLLELSIKFLELLSMKRKRGIEDDKVED